jgi:DNA (cytosine-5)-methyltransferase 1
MNYYNDNDKKCCAWMKELIRDGLIPDGEVSDKDVRDIRPEELEGYEQVHLFAGIGGWPLALQWAGWHGPVWTGSCPCQPFSVAGKGKGTADERHLWPSFRWLLSECKPPVVFGEQVASKAGRAWLAGVQADLEALGYATGAADLCAASVNAPHIRARLWWCGVADSHDAGSQGRERGELCECAGQCTAGQSSASGGGVAQDTTRIGWRGRRDGDTPRHEGPLQAQGLGAHGDWHNTILHPCRDGKARRIPAEPSLFPLAHGIPGRVGLLRGAGNAIVPQVAAEFVMAFMEAVNADS